MSSYIFFLLFIGVSFFSTHIILKGRFFRRQDLFIFLLPPFFLILGLVLNPEISGIIDIKDIKFSMPFLDFILASLGFYYGMQFQKKFLQKISINFAFFSFIYTFFFAFIYAIFIYFLFPVKNDVSIILGIISFALANVCFSPYSLTLLYLNKMIDTQKYNNFIIITTLMGGVALFLEFSIDCIFYPLSIPLSDWIINPYIMIFIIIGFIFLLAFFFHYIIQFTENREQLLFVTVGFLFFIGGLFSMFHLPPLLGSFILGVIIGNSLIPKKNQIVEILSRIEQPFFIFMLIFSSMLVKFYIPFSVSIYYFIVLLVAKYIIIVFLLRAFSYYFQLKIIESKREGILFLENSPLGLAIMLNQELIFKNKYLDVFLLIYLFSFIAFHFFGILLSSKKMVNFLKKEKKF